MCLQISQCHGYNTVYYQPSHEWVCTVNNKSCHNQEEDKGYISCIENKLYVSRMKVEKHLLSLSSMRIVKGYASISITHRCHCNISVVIDQNDFLMCQNYAQKSVLSLHQEYHLNIEV